MIGFNSRRIVISTKSRIFFARTIGTSTAGAVLLNLFLVLELTFSDLTTSPPDPLEILGFVESEVLNHA